MKPGDKVRPNLGIERRTFALGDIDTRADGGHPRLRGHAAVFNSLSLPISVYGFTFREQIAPGAFADAIARAKESPDNAIFAYWNHSADDPIGCTASGTLDLSEDERGLAIDLKPVPTSRGDDVVILISKGVVRKMSFGFQVPVGGDTWDIINGEDVRTLRKINLIEVSPVTRPAYTATDIGARIAQVVGVEARDLDGASERLVAGAATREDRALLRHIAERLAERAGLTAEERVQMEQNRRRLVLASATA